jgi:hypothetical protein
MREFAAQNATPGIETGSFGAFSPTSVPRSSVMTSSSDLP